MPGDSVRQFVEDLDRRESRSVFATLIRVIRDFELAEDAVQQAFTAAIERWGSEGIPENPGAWIVSTARFKAIDEDERQACVAESTSVCHELAANGQFLGASPLHPVATATSVRIRAGRLAVTDGPFAETVEQLGRYYLIDVPELDAAIAVARCLPPAKWGTVEIRPTNVLDDIPNGAANIAASQTTTAS